MLKTPLSQPVGARRTAKNDTQVKRQSKAWKYSERSCNDACMNILAETEQYAEEPVRDVGEPRGVVPEVTSANTAVAQVIRSWHLVGQCLLSMGGA